MAEKYIPITAENMKPAFVVIDMQLKYLLSEYNMDDRIPGVIALINKTADLFRERGFPVFFVAFESDEPNEKDALHPDIIMKEGEPIVLKKTMDAFRDTDLDVMIKEKGCDTAVMAGIFASHCVISTYFGAFYYHISSFILESGILSSKKRSEEIVEELCKTVSYDALQEHLGLGHPVPESQEDSSTQKCQSTSE